MPRKATGQVIPPSNGRGWAIRLPAYGKRRYITFDDCGDRQEAEAELRHVLADVERGTWQAHEPERVEAPAEVPTFHEFASEWYRRHELDWREATKANYRQQLSVHLLPFFADLALDQITVRQIDTYREGKLREGRLCPEQINYTIKRLAQILDEAVEYELIDANPAKGKRRRAKVEKTEQVFLDHPDQIETLLEAAGRLDDDRKARFTGRRPFIATLLFAGLRISEACALKRRDLDLANNRLSVRDSKTSAGRRRVEVLGGLRDELAVYAADADPDAPPFPNARGGHEDRGNARQRIVDPVITEARKLVALPERLTAHNLRHTYASALIACGKDPVTVRHQIGHADAAFTLRVYAHALDLTEAEREALKAVYYGDDWADKGRQTDSAGLERIPAEQAERRNPSRRAG